jgi:hypothetical protein
MSTISAGLSNTTAIVVTGDTTGNLVLRSNGTTTAVTIDTNQNATFANSVTVTGTINANISGNGASLTDINASNITSGTISNAFTTANSANGASTIVARDSNGSFTGNVVNATDVNSANVSATDGVFTNISGSGAGVTNINASNISSGTIDNARTSAASANGASTIVLRDSNGSFAGNVITGTTGSFTNVSGNGATLTDINASSISSGTIDNARTTAATANGASTIVLRGSTGEFAAGAITADSFTGNGAAISGINASNVSSGTIDNARTTAASANGASTIVARDSNGSFTANSGTFTTLSGDLTGNVVLTTGTISTAANSATDIVNKAYVDNAVSAGVHFHEPVLVESPTALDAVYVQPNGAGNGVGATLTNNGSNVALSIDGVSLSNTARVLVYTQANTVHNGVYTVTNPGNVSAQWVLTRATDADTYVTDSPNGLSEGSTFFVQDGDTGAGETYTCNTPGTITFGTTGITFAQVSSAQIYSAGTGLTLDSTTFSLTNTAVTAATYGNDGAVPQIAVNAQGQITSASNVSINASSITVGTLANGRTTAASANGASTIVARDSDGSFTANVITSGSISGNGSALSSINASNVSSGTLSATFGGTGSANLTADNVILGNGANTVKVVAPGTANNVLTSNGSTWISQAPAGGGATITNDNTTASALYPLFTASTSGTLSNASVNSAKLTYTPSTGNLVATIHYASSDARHKTDIKNIPDALVKISQINGVTYIRTDNDQNIRHAGVIAQEVEKVLPEVIGTDADGYKVIAYGNMIGLLVEAIKELKAEVDALKG